MPVRIKEFTLTAVTADVAGIVASIAPTFNVPLALIVATLSPPREITITSAGDVSSVPYDIVGRDRNGNTIRETLVGPNATTVTSRGVYAAVVSITPSQTLGTAASVGWGSRVPSNWIQRNTTESNDTIEEPSVYVSADGAASEFAVETTNEHLAYPAKGNTPRQGDITRSAVVAVAVNPISAGTTEKVPAFEASAYFRIVKTNTGTGALTVRIARPRF